MRTLVIAFVAVVIALFGCGREDVELLVYIGKVPDAGPTTSGGPDACARSCLSRSSNCAAPADCCSGRCEGGVCLDASCGAPGTGCTTRSECCSGRCEPTSAGLTCLPYCKPDGASCSRALDCCGLACNGGVCGGAPCGRRGASCGADSACCSGRCDTDGTCALDETFACRPSGEDCTSGSGSGCCGACGAGGACVPGPGPCFALGVACQADGDCCRGTCALDGSGRRVCTAACAATGESCVRDGDCCSKSCTLADSKCAGQAPTTCP